MSIGVIYGSTTGNTEHVAELIAAKLGNAAVLHNIAERGLQGVEQYRACIFGIPTWDFGELQEDWHDCWDALLALDLAGRPCAIFGLGDQIGYGEWFVDGMGQLCEALLAIGAQVIGEWPIDGYKFEASKALNAQGTHFVGLALDEDSQHAESEQRIDAWLATIKGAMQA